MEKTEERKNSIGDPMLRCLIGGFAGLMTELLVLYGAAALIHRGTVGERYGGYFIILGAFIGAAVAGYIASKGQGGNPMAQSVIGGIVFLLLSVVLGALFARDISFGIVIIKLGICALMGGMFGGAITVRPKKRHKQKKRR